MGNTNTKTVEAAKTALATWTAASKPATLANHAKSILAAVKAGETSKGRIVAHISAIDRAELWKGALDDDGEAFKSLNKYLIDVLDLSPTAVSLYIKVARMVTDENGDLVPWFAPFTVSQLQEMLPISQICIDDTATACEDAGISPDMTCKAIRDAVKAFLSDAGDDADEDGDEGETADEDGDNEEAADTLAGYIMEVDDSEDVTEWLGEVPESVRDLVTTVLFKRV